MSGGTNISLFIPFLLSHPAALSADTYDPQQMLSDLKTVFRGHRILDRLQLSRIELNDLAALRADHMIVMLVLVIVFEVGAAIAKANFACQAGVR